MPVAPSLTKEIADLKPIWISVEKCLARVDPTFLADATSPQTTPPEIRRHQEAITQAGSAVVDMWAMHAFNYCSKIHAHLDQIGNDLLN